MPAHHTAENQTSPIRANVHWMAGPQCELSIQDAVRQRSPQLCAYLLPRASPTLACFDNASSSWVRGAIAPTPRHDDAHPRGPWAGNPLHGRRGPARLLRVPRGPDGAVGLARPRIRLLGRAPDRRDRSTATGFARPRYLVTRTTSSCSRPRWASCRFPRENDRREVAPAARGACWLIDLEQGRFVADEDFKRGERRDRKPLSRSLGHKKRTPRIVLIEDPQPRCQPASRARTCPLLDRQQVLRLHAGGSQASLMQAHVRHGQVPWARWAPTRRSRPSPTSRSCLYTSSSRTSRR